MFRLPCIWLLLGAAVGAPSQQIEYRTLWSSDFEQVAVGAVPPDMIVLNGAFAVRQVDDNRFLSLPGEPLNTMGIVFGPSRREQVRIAAHILAKKRGRRVPAFGVGLGGVRGYRAMMRPAIGALQITHNDRVIAQVPYDWVAAQWHGVELNLSRSDGDSWRISARIWRDDPAESIDTRSAMVSADIDRRPPAGGATLWGLPFSGLPIRYDDVRYDEQIAAAD